MKRLTLLVGLVLALGGTLAGPAGAVDAAPAATERLQALDQAILARLNATRVAHGLRPLRLSPELQRAAVFQSRSMLEGGFFTHDSRDGSSFVVRLKRFYRTAGYRSWAAGENLLYNSAEISADEAIEAWLGSAHHRENMLDPGWREVGIGSLHAASAGGTFAGEPAWVITMDFGAREGPVKAKRTAAVQTKKAKKPVSRAAAQSAKARTAKAAKTKAAKTKAAKTVRPAARKAPSAAPAVGLRGAAPDDTAEDETTAEDEAFTDDEPGDVGDDPAGGSEDAD